MEDPVGHILLPFRTVYPDRIFCTEVNLPFGLQLETRLVKRQSVIKAAMHLAVFNADHVSESGWRFFIDIGNVVAGGKKKAYKYRQDPEQKFHQG